MGSHYIKVGSFKLDQELMDTICPAAGYDTTPPDPGIYCPAHGYYEETAIWEPPIEIIEPSPESIILFCDDTGYGLVRFYCYASGGTAVKVELLDAAYNVLSTDTFTNYYTVTFPTQGDGFYYIIRLSPNVNGESLEKFWLLSETGYPDKDFSVYLAIFNTPNMVDLGEAFRDNKHLREVRFIGDMNSLTLLDQIFNGSSVEKITWPTSMSSVTNMMSMIRATTRLKSLDLSAFDLSSVTTLDYFAYEANVESIKLPTSMPAVTTMKYLVYKCYKISSIQLPTAEMTALQYLNYAFEYSSIEEVIFPAMPALLQMGYIFGYCKQLRIVKFQGDLNNLTQVTSAFNYGGSDSLEELILGDNMTSLTSFYMTSSYPKLKKLGLPFTFSSGDVYSRFASSNLLEEFTRTMPVNSVIVWVNCLSHKLTAFNQPYLKVEGITIGYNSSLIAPLTSVEVDWANSTWDQSSTPLVLRADLDATELDRIFTALPSVVNSQQIDVRYCTGYAGCNPSIATSKGWVVL